MSSATRAALESAIDAHIRDEFPEEHDDQHLVAWAIVASYESLDETDAEYTSTIGSSKSSATTGLLVAGIAQMLEGD